MKRFVPLVVILGLLGLAGCSGDSPSAPPVPTVVPEAWAITSISVSDPNPLLGNVVLVLVEVTRNGSAAPDGTTVRLTSTGGGLFSCSTGEVVPGVTEAMVATQDGVACAQFVSLEPGAYAITATVHAVTRQVQVTYQPYDPTDALQIFQPLLPNRGPYNGGQPLTIRGKGIVAPVDVVFSVDDVVGGKQVVQYPAIVQSVVESNPPSATGTIQIITPFISHVRDDERIERPADVTVTVAVGTGGEQQEVLTEAYTYEDEIIVIPPEDQAVWRITGTPVIYVVQPDSGPSAGGNTVTIIGNHFAAILLAPNGQILDRRSIVDRVLFNNLEGIVQQVSPDGQQIQVTLPRFSTTPLTEDLPVTVVVEFTSDIDSESGFPDGIPDVDVNFDGTPDATIPSANRQSAYIVLADEPQPDIVSLTPSSGPIDGGTQVTIYGAGFQLPLEVRFGALTAQQVQLIDDTTLADDDIITCVTPDYSQQGEEVPITVDVQVTNLRTGKSDTLEGGYTYGDNLYITGNSPFRGGLGTPVVIFGAGFEDPLEVFFATDLKMDVLSVSGTELLVRFPTDLEPQCSDRTGTFTVSLLEAQRTAEGGSFVLLGNRPSVVSVDPTFVQSIADGDDVDPDEVTIFGVNFADDLIVEIGGSRMLSSDITVVDSSTIEVTNLPSPNEIGLVFDQVQCLTDDGILGVRNAPTPVDVTVMNLPGECSNTLTGGIVYEPDDLTCVVGPVIALSQATIAFADTLVSTNGSSCDSVVIQVSNVGDQDVVWSATGATPPFSVAPPFGSIAVGDPPTDVTVSFCPTVAGPFSATITFTATNGNQVPLGVSGLGVSPVIVVSPTALAFTADGSRLVDISNSAGTAPLVWNATITGASPGTYTLGAITSPVAAGSATTLSVTYATDGTPPNAATLEITHNDPTKTSPITVTLTGNP